MKKKAKKENSKTIYSIIDDYKKFLEENVENFPTEELKEKSIQLIIESDQIVKKTKEEGKGSLIITLFFMCIFLGLLLYSHINLNRIDNLNNDIHQKNMIIYKLQRTDSLYHKFMDDRGTGITYRLKSDTTVMTYRDLMNESDSIRREYYKLKSEIFDMEWQLTRIKERYDIYCIEENGYLKFMPCKADSALRIYPYFKDNVEFMPDGSLKVYKNK